MVENFDGEMCKHLFDNIVNKGYTFHHQSSPPLNFTNCVTAFISGFNRKLALWNMTVMTAEDYQKFELKSVPLKRS